MGEHWIEITTKIGCGAMCGYCPQNKLYKSYCGEIFMTMDTFKKCISSIPKNIEIHFTGFCESFLNPRIIDFIEYALDAGHSILINTTLKGMKKKYIDRLTKLVEDGRWPGPLTVHLPCQEYSSNIISDEYYKILDYTIKTFKNVRFHNHGTPVEEVSNFIKKYGEYGIKQRKIHSRAGNLEFIDTSGLQKRNICSRIYDHVLLPNGDVTLCCVDYGLEEVIGNLKEMSYNELHSTEKFKKIVEQGSDICKRCEHYGVNVDIMVNDMQGTLNVLYKLLSREKKVYYCRFGDGDFNIMTGTSGELYHDFSEPLRWELIKSFYIDDPNYIRGVMVCESTFNGIKLQKANPEHDSRVKTFIGNLYSFGNENKEINLYSHVLFTFISIDQQNIMTNFLDNFIRPKKKLFIGSVDKDKIERLVGNIDYYVKVPCTRERVPGKLTGAYYSIDDWWPDVLKYVDDVDLVLPAAGMAGRVITKRLWQLDKNIHCIELGSLIDAACGVLSRSTWVRAGNSINNLLIK